MTECTMSRTFPRNSLGARAALVAMSLAAAYPASAGQLGLDVPDPAAVARMIEASASAPALTQDATRVSAHKDWSVFVEHAPQGCWITSLPSESRAYRDGKPVTVKRGTIALNVLVLPDGTPELSFEAGYPINPGSPVMLTVKDQQFELKSSGEAAWAVGEGEDAKIAALMQRAGVARVSGVSTRGTRTEDQFSMMGVSSALEEASAACK